MLFLILRSIYVMGCFSAMSDDPIVISHGILGDLPMLSAMKQPLDLGSTNDKCVCAYVTPLIADASTKRCQQCPQHPLTASPDKQIRHRQCLCSQALHTPNIQQKPETRMLPLQVPSTGPTSRVSLSPHKYRVALLLVFAIIFLVYLCHVLQLKFYFFKAHIRA